MSNDELIKTIFKKIFPEGVELNLKPGKSGNSDPYLVIPNHDGCPRWIIPQSSIYGIPVLKQWHPYQIKSVLKWALLIYFYKLGILTCLPGIRMISCSIPESLWSSIGWDKHESPVPVIFIGNPSTISRLSVFLVDKSSSTIEQVVKVPYGTLSPERILNENSILRVLQIEKPGLAPQPIFFDSVRCISSETAILGKTGSRELSFKHIQWLLDLKRHGDTITLRDCMMQLKQIIQLSKSYPEHYHDYFSQAFQYLDDSTKLQAVYIHGDYAPWNIKDVKDDKIAVIDWEKAQLRGVPLYDLVHFKVIQAYVFKKNENILQMMLTDPLVLEYIKTMEINKDFVPKLYLYYLLSEWYQRHQDGNAMVEQYYLEHIINMVKMLNENSIVSLRV